MTPAASASLPRGEPSGRDLCPYPDAVAERFDHTLRVGDVFLKVDADQTRTDVEVEAMGGSVAAEDHVLSFLDRNEICRRTTVSRRTAKPGPPAVRTPHCRPASTRVAYRVLSPHWSFR